jgi:hypothetical protein
MSKSALIAASAAILLCGAGSASAATVKYTFADSSGFPYCDGITLTETSGVAVGTHTANTRCAGGYYAGGFSGKKVLGSADTQWVITTNDTYNDPGYLVVFVLDQTAMTWAAYTESTSNSATFELAGSGVLLKGAPKPNGEVSGGSGTPSVSIKKS